MRVSREKAAENRERILEGAARLFRERGMSEVGVDTLADSVGLTYGSLYSHFGSKEALMVAAVDHAFTRLGTRLSTTENLADYVAWYLSPEHRDNPGAGCSVAALGAEMPRRSKAVRRAFTEGFRGALARIAGRLPSTGRRRRREDEALALVATLVGSMVMARAVDDPVLSDRILAAARTRLASA